MGEDQNNQDLGKGFEEKSSYLATSLTEEERQRTGNKVIKTLRMMRQKALDAGLNEDMAQEIMDEYYAEKKSREEDHNA